MQNIVIRNMSRCELDSVMAWAAAEGWNPGLNDAECFYETDPSGFFIALDGRGEIIGAISAVAYGVEFGFIGLYIVRPEYRGRTVGLLLGQRAMEYLGTRNIGLDGVEKKVKNYETRGFKLAYRNIRYEGIRSFQPGQLHPAVSLFNRKMDELIAFDRLFFPASRDKFLEKWINAPNAKVLCFYEKDKIRAYGVIRKCVEGFKIGPLFAERYECAAALFNALLAHTPENCKFYLDIPEINENALKLAAEYKMKSVFGTARMYSRNAPLLPLEKIYGITSFELG